jgi:hypothetical protein
MRPLEAGHPTEECIQEAIDFLPLGEGCGKSFGSCETNFGLARIGLINPLNRRATQCAVSCELMS